MAERKSNYDIMADAARELFCTYDQEPMIRAFGLESNAESLYIDFFGVRHRIDRASGAITVADESGEWRSAGFHAAMCIYDVLCYAKRNAATTGNWRMMQSLSPHSNFRGDGTHFGRAAARFSGRVDELCRRLDAIGMRQAGKADAEYVIDAFAFLPMLVRFWEADEDFAAKFDFMMDEATLDFMHFETAWYIAGHLMEMLGD